ncbi:UvrD-helicase domain-containing protein [Nocardiopsis ansamitocini]|uniref:DNA 3'-5' helicase n=1 Tax=Nocardiopsis ansamitocini TaxID=1670832 RepID=A0A9W6P584_9ACTN|nr:UvrD-helicase domain-containing protein [Nocardiopsis ansamitocini]GLU47381.1 DNA helicase [Nocardiopsis ansamitocini]
MEFHADLHIHSKYSRACSKDCDLEHLAWWAARKGVGLVGTGDFTHPAWRAELERDLVPAEPGLFRLNPETEARVLRTLPPSCQRLPRFMLSVEISTIYKRGDRTRKVHHLLYAPSMDAARTITADLAKIGNLASDGRPILGLDSRDLLEITLSSDPDSYLVPAHIWTPWFSALGSKSGFDAIADCYADLAGHIFAVETGLSSDPAMNWMVSSLDSYTLVSNSDAHSPPMLAREASRFDTELDYYSVKRALETGSGFRGSVEFFPEEGKYHLDGHRKCDIRFTPEVTRAHKGRCPVCGKPLTVGVFHRVHELADRDEGYQVPGSAQFTSLVPLPEIVGEIVGVGPKSKRVMGEVARLVGALGPELEILHSVPLDEVSRAGGELLGEAITRLRRGSVIRDSGYDGEYGVIRMFTPEELHAETGAMTLFGEDEIAPAKRRAMRPSAPKRPAPPAAPLMEPLPTDPVEPDRPTAEQPGDPMLFPQASNGQPRRAQGLLDGLDPDQRAAAERVAGPLLIVAGPGTGKTRTLTHRIAHLVAERGVAPQGCLAITFTRRAADELRERLTGLLPDEAARMTVTTFHGLGSLILREQAGRAGLTRDFGIADEAQRLVIAAELCGSEAQGRKLLAQRDRGAGTAPDSDTGTDTGTGTGTGTDDSAAEADYERRLRERNLADFTDLLRLPVRLLDADPDLAAAYRDRWPWVSVDEYQDIDGTQYALLRLLTTADGNLTAIGDPDQAIYGFRGADVGFFLRFAQDFPAARSVRLTRNYRSNATIVAAAVQAIAPTSLVPGRALRAVGDFSDPPRIGLHVAADERAEASFVARAIDRLLGGTSLHSLDSGRVTDDGHDGLGFGDVSVLYRTDAQSAALMSAFDNAGIPFQKRSHDRLLARPGVRALAAELAHQSQGPLTERVRAAVAALCERAGTDTETVTDLRTAGELVAPLAARAGDDLSGFLAELSLGAEVDALDPRADRVALLTLHAAKGLEYPVVFLVGCEDGMLPFRFPGAERDDEAEERRLFFVGLTRAQQRLYLSRARERTRYKTVREAAASPFLAAIGPELTMPVDEESATRKRPSDRQLRLI